MIEEHVQQGEGFGATWRKGAHMKSSGQLPHAGLSPTPSPRRPAPCTHLLCAPPLLPQFFGQLAEPKPEMHSVLRLQATVAEAPPEPAAAPAPP